MHIESSMDANILHFKNIALPLSSNEENEQHITSSIFL